MRQDIRIRSSQGPEFDCYVVTPDKEQPVPAVVLASAIHGVDHDLRGIADEFASHGYIAAAPDQVWAEVAGVKHHVTVDQLTGEPRDRAWAQIIERFPRYQGYTDKTDRELPILDLTPRP